MDWMEQEQERGHNHVGSNYLRMERSSNQYYRHPGHVTTIEVERSLCAYCAVAVLIGGWRGAGNCLASSR